MLNIRKCPNQPRSEYHLGVSMNSKQSFRIFCDIPLSSTTDDSGLRLRGCPKSRHSEPIAVYKSVFPSVYCNANSLAGTTVCQLNLYIEGTTKKFVPVPDLIITFFEYFKIQLFVPSERSQLHRFERYTHLNIQS